jgi:hypothetical protein
MNRHQLSQADREFLRAIGVSTEPTFDEMRLELARRIAKHRAPGVHASMPETDARLGLVRLALERLLAAATETE